MTIKIKHEHSRAHRFGDRDVVTYGLAHPWGANAYHFFLKMRWWQFFAVAGLTFLALNALFACLYLLGSAPIANQNPGGFWGAFFFSVETLATVGYGDMHPDTPYGHAIATLEIFVGMVNVALATGMIFARFSRPRALIQFADQPVVHPVNGRQTLTIRAANGRQNVILEASAKLRLIRSELTQEGHMIRRIHDLQLVREQQPMFMFGWTLMHVIDETSPLWGSSAEQLIQQDAGLILTLSGIDETTSQSMQGRKTYALSKVQWNKRYRDFMRVDGEGVTHLDFNHFHSVESVPNAAVSSNDGV